MNNVNDYAGAIGACYDKDKGTAWIGVNYLSWQFCLVRRHNESCTLFLDARTKLSQSLVHNSQSHVSSHKVADWVFLGQLSGHLR